MTDDVVSMTPGRAPFGKAGFAAEVERTKSVAIEARAEVQEIEVFGPRPTPAIMFGLRLLRQAKRRSAYRDMR